VEKLNLPCKTEIKQHNFESIILIEREIIYTHSTAVIKILSNLGGLWKITKLCYLLPKKIRDSLYLYLSHKRYFILGKADACLIPSGETQSKFL
jgi:predicted DCC family thiol-disulfide oxidoreductase YuxK